MRDHFTGRLRCLTYAFLCQRYDDEADLYSFLAESMAQFFYVRRHDYVRRSTQLEFLMSHHGQEHVLPLPDVLFALHLVAKVGPSIFDDAIQYGKLAGGIYGWRVFLYYNPFSCHKVLACCHPRDIREHSKGHHGPRDDLSFLSYTGVVHTSIQYISGANELFKVPFLVCRNDEKKEIVVAIRGSFSWHDVLTDVVGRTIPMADDEAIPSPTGGGRPIHTHEGVLRSARHLLHELQSGMLRGSFWDFAQANCRLDDANATWRVVLTGHSLGGGIAALLTLMLRKELNVHGYLFAPMAVLDDATADWTASFMTTFIYGDDWIPRLSTRNIMRLRNEVMQEYRNVSNATLLSVYLARFDPTRMSPQIHPEWADLELLQPEAGTALVIPGTIYQIAPTSNARLCACEKLMGRQVPSRLPKEQEN
ncbi:hypothetical protein DYB32_005214 [Aphanomyces invadans]|uniref:sn-1-specific diacylglycerol lipase n=1 Tax=Aphanomyces invadans TaxID=157072 RepID=A0A3R7A8L5_9STRA|nr:hypothetical protein DYB32_005214 [Aphanomyces invadans]